ncbi:MAG TPA: DNA primase, partial [Flavisolibacter sp.]|nr:DNA primase [Flavisolibacter sp.]
MKELDLVVYLESLGYAPQKIRNNDYWYLSPLRPENEPSFKVNRRLNAWYDHSLGKGGNLVDFGLLYHGCSVRELLQKMQPFFSLHPPKSSPLLTENSTEAHIRIVRSGPLLHPALYRYLRERKINVAVAKQYIEEVHFALAGRSYYAFGFRNNQGGFELRNRYFKGSSSPKDSTLLEQKGATELAVVEGFFSFLSYQTA